MSYTLRMVHCSNTPQTDAYVADKVSDIERIAGSDARIEVELKREGGVERGETYVADMNVHLRDGTVIRGSHRGTHLHEAIDVVKDEVLQQLRKGKGRKDSLMKRGGAWVKEWLRYGNAE